MPFRNEDSQAGRAAGAGAAGEPAEDAADDAPADAAFDDEPDAASGLPLSVEHPATATTHTARTTPNVFRMATTVLGRCPEIPTTTSSQR